MNNLKQWILISSLFLLLFVVNSETAAQTFPRGVSWKQVRTEHFIVVFRNAHRELVPMVTEMVESVHQEMSRFFNYHATKTLYVVLSDYLDTFDRLDLLATQRLEKIGLSSFSVISVTERPPLTFFYRNGSQCNLSINIPMSSDIVWI